MDALEAGKLGEKGKAFAEFLRSQGKAAAGRYSEGVEEDLGEIEELKQELQEVNLLNAKLLYTNKIFKATPAATANDSSTSTSTFISSLKRSASVSSSGFDSSLYFLR